MNGWAPSALLRYLTNQSGAASFEGAWVPCYPGSLLVFEVAWSAVALTSGTLGLQGSLDSAFAAANIITLPTFGAGNAGVFGVWPTVGATADNGAILIKNPFPFMRLTYTAAAGGGANQFQAWRELRNVG